MHGIPSLRGLFVLTQIAGSLSAAPKDVHSIPRRLTLFMVYFDETSCLFLFDNDWLMRGAELNDISGR
jgi:hypothetical protein